MDVTRFWTRQLRILTQALILAALLTALPARCADLAEEEVEAHVKAAFLFNFVRFVEWPAEPGVDAQSPITIGISGRDTLGAVLDGTVQGKIVGGRPIRIRRLTGTDQAEQCQVLFITEKKQMKSIRQLLAGKPVLTVGDFDGALREGSIIEFRLVEESVRFEISLEAAGHARLNISSQLLKVALRTAAR